MIFNKNGKRIRAVKPTLEQLHKVQSLTKREQRKEQLRVSNQKLIDTAITYHIFGNHRGFGNRYNQLFHPRTKDKMITLGNTKTVKRGDTRGGICTGETVVPQGKQPRVKYGNQANRTNKTRIFDTPEDIPFWISGNNHYEPIEKGIVKTTGQYKGVWYARNSRRK